MNKSELNGAAEIEASLELLAERCGDPTPYVYADLFSRHPELEVHFWRDTDGSIRGAMLSRAFEAILDFVGERRYADHMVQNEMITHEGYDIPRQAFSIFFEVIRDTAKRLLGAAWSDGTDRAWRDLLVDLSSYTSTVPIVPESNPYFKKLAADFEAKGAAHLAEPLKVRLL